MNKSSLKRKEFLHANSLRQIIQKNIINLYKQGESAAQLAREYGIGYSTVHKWIQGQAKTQSGKSPDEIKAMEKRLASLSEENEILKKALGFLAQK
ncbi:helix-turn-helix domain-containing protein [Lactiplantibacillus plantarum]|uniref:helix-turn-helix domain-containing protein n=2 Tax=Lactiplantibacillus plantarum TaxID=1590 RepID=UPI001FBB3CCD|nr:helix-turn-helix domain-containing protein [Lactiplantibacillus plantarum]